MTDPTHVTITLGPVEVAQVRAALAASARWGQRLWTEEQRDRINGVGARLARAAVEAGAEVDLESVTGVPPKWGRADGTSE